MKARRWAEQWCERKGGCCCGRRRLSWHVACACLDFAFRRTSDKCGNGAVRGGGGAVRGASSVGHVVARAGGAVVATACG